MNAQHARCSCTRVHVHVCACVCEPCGAAVAAVATVATVDTVSRLPPSPPPSSAILFLLLQTAATCTHTAHALFVHACAGVCWCVLVCVCVWEPRVCDWLHTSAILSRTRPATQPNFFPCTLEQEKECAGTAKRYVTLFKNVSVTRAARGAFSSRENLQDAPTHTRRTHTPHTHAAHTRRTHTQCDTHTHTHTHTHAVRHTARGEKRVCTAVQWVGARRHGRRHV